MLWIGRGDDILTSQKLETPETEGEGEVQAPQTGRSAVDEEEWNETNQFLPSCTT
jgi:hypothetical protein